MPRNITVVFADGSRHVYQNAPDNVTPEQVSQRAQQEFGKQVQSLDGGRQANQRPAARPQQRSAGNALAEAGKSTTARLIEGAGGLFDIVSMPGNAINRGLNRLIGGAGDAVLRAGGFNNAANALQGAVEGADRNLAKPHTFAAQTARISPPETRPGGAVGDFVGQMAGGMMLPIPGPRAPRPRAPVAAPANPARQIVREGAQRGVRVMTSDVRPPRTVAGKLSRTVGESIPFAGTAGPRAAQQAERVAAVRALAQEFGAVGADDAVEAVAADMAKTRGAMLTKLTTAKDSVINGIQGAVQTPQAIKAIDDQIGKLSGINAEKFAPIIRELEGFKATLASGKNLSQIEGNRRLLGDLFKDPNLASISGDGQKALNAIYAPLRADMGNFIRAKGGDAAFNRWKGANDRLSAMAGELDNTAFKNVLANAEVTPENVAKLLFSKKPSDVRRLVSNLSGPGRAKAQAAVIFRALDRASGKEGVEEVISPDRFVTVLDDLKASSGVVFDAADNTRLEGFKRLMNATQQAAAANATLNTGARNTPLVGGLTLGTIFGAASFPVAGGLGLIARAYESAPVRNALLKLGRAPAGSQQAAQLTQRAQVAFASFLSRESGSLAALNDNVGVPLAASDGQEDQPEQQQPLP